MTELYEEMSVVQAYEKQSSNYENSHEKFQRLIEQRNWISNIRDNKQCRVCTVQGKWIWPWIEWMIEREIICNPSFNTAISNTFIPVCELAASLKIKPLFCCRRMQSKYAAHNGLLLSSFKMQSSWWVPEEPQRPSNDYRSPPPPFVNEKYFLSWVHAVL